MDGHLLGDMHLAFVISFCSYAPAWHTAEGRP